MIGSFQISNLEFQISNLKSRISNFRFRPRRIGMLSADAHEPAHVPRVAFEEDLRAAKLALLLGSSGAAQMRGQRMVSLELALGGDLEALGDRLVGLELVSHRGSLDEKGTRKHKKHPSGNSRGGGDSTSRVLRRPVAQNTRKADGARRICAIFHPLSSICVLLTASREPVPRWRRGSPRTRARRRDGSGYSA